MNRMDRRLIGKIERSSIVKAKEIIPKIVNILEIEDPMLSNGRNTNTV